MPTFAELASFRDRNRALVDAWRRALVDCYASTSHLEVQAEVDQTPNLLIDRTTTRATLFAMGYTGTIEGTRRTVQVKTVEHRLDS